MTQLFDSTILYIALWIREILVPTLIVGGITLFLGAVIAVVSKVFDIPRDPLQSQLLEALPGANCGSCGFSGCEGYAAHLARGGKDTAKCPVGGEETAVSLASLLGIPAKPFIPQVAHVHCNGTSANTTKRYDYQGVLDCRQAQSLYAGPGSCTFGCMGFGDCVRKCPYEAIELVGGVAVVNRSRCKACGLCVSVCPKGLISILPAYDGNFIVECKNKWSGGETKKHCFVGCIGCRRCFSVCPSGAVSMDGPLASIDPLLCTQCGKCREVCLSHCISGPLINKSSL